jgi:hypothetical protein
MKTTSALLAAGLLALAACADNTATTPAPTGGSAGAEGIGYCDSPPSNPDELEDWNQLCMPER